MMHNVEKEFSKRVQQMSRKISSSESQSRKMLIVTAAASVFLRYGYERTTMAELADAAGLSRPTLYEVFPGKDDLFSAVIHHLSRQTIQQYRDILPKLRTMRTKLQRFCGDWATHGLRLAERHPDAKDLFDFRFSAVKQMYEDFVEFLVEVIRAEQHGAKVPVEKVVRNLVYSLRGLKDAAHNVDHMEELIHLQVDIFLVSLAPARNAD